MEVPVLLVSIGIIGGLMMFAFRLWEISRGRHNADRDRRLQQMPVEALLKWSVSGTRRFLPRITTLRGRARDITARTRKEVSNNRGFIGFQDFVRGKHHTPSSGRPSPFLKDVAQHKEKLPRERLIEEE